MAKQACLRLLRLLLQLVSVLPVLLLPGQPVPPRPVPPALQPVLPALRPVLYLCRRFPDLPGPDLFRRQTQAVRHL